METESVIILVGIFGVLLMLGVPVAFSIGMATACTLLTAMDTGPALTVGAQRLATGLDSFALLAIPFFVLAGKFMNRGGIAKRLIEFAKTVVGMLPGGLAYVNIMACMIFGAISGSAVAATAAIGGFMAPVMKKEGYDENFSAAANISSSTVGLLIPPSNVLIVYSLASGGVSIAALFIAGYFPGILVGFGLMVVAGVISVMRKYPVGERIALKEAVLKFLDALPSLMLIIVIMGGIISGMFTPTEASAIAVLYTFVLSVVIYREVKWKEVPEILLDAVGTTAVVMLLVGASMGMSWVLSFERIPQGVSELLLTLTDNPIVILLIINILLLAVGTFMDITPAILIFTPIFLPVVIQFGMSPIHFGIVLVMNLCIGICTPPVGSALFVGCGVAGLKLTSVLRIFIPFYIMMIVCLLLVTYFEGISLWLPRLFGY